MRILLLVSFFSLFSHIICSKESERGTEELRPAIYRLEELTKQPIIRELPKTNWDVEVSGTVVVEFVIFKDGSVGEVKLISSTHEILSEIAINDVKKFLFFPGEVNGSPVNTIAKMEIPYIIRSNDKGSNQSLEVTQLAGASSAPQL